jgi:hypothetical protein
VLRLRSIHARRRFTLACALLVLGVACGDQSRDGTSDGGGSHDADAGDASALPYAREVVSFEPGKHAGFGEDDLPEVVLGPPQGGGVERGSLDVLSLGQGGEIVLGFGERAIGDGKGADFVVFENAFWPGGDESAVYADPGEVSVSDDGETWKTFSCDAGGDGMGHYAGCAGWSPTLEYDAFEVVPLDPKRTGGDAFDLAEVGLKRARYVRIHDLATKAEGNAAGFDLDAVGIVHEAD